MVVEVHGGEMSREEIAEYAAIIQKKSRLPIDKLDLTIVTEGEEQFVDIRYEFLEVPFERIRRITGYLVGNLTRFNNAKLAEVGDRVSHSYTEITPSSEEAANSGR